MCFCRPYLLSFIFGGWEIEDTELKVNEFSRHSKEIARTGKLLVPPAQLPPRAQQTHFGGTFRRLKQLCNVADTPVVEIAEIDHRLFLQCQAVQRLAEHREIDFFFEQRMDIGFRPLVYFQIFLVNKRDPALAHAHQVHAMVVGNGKQPGRELAARLEGAHFGNELDKNILGDIFGAGSVPREGKALLINFYGIALVKFAEIPVIPGFKEKCN